MAQLGGWRTAESSLHLCELLGGWPGAFIANFDYSAYKTERDYQVTFWLIVVAHEFAAFDYLQAWRFSRIALNLISSRLAQG